MAINFPVGGCNLRRTRAAGSSFPMASEASKAREDKVGTASSAESSVVVVLSIDWPPDAAAAAEAEERREEAATASISLKLRLSLTRSDKLLTEISEKKITIKCRKF